MASMKYYDKHNQVGFLKKPEESAGFAEIVDFLKGSHIRYALTHNPTIHDSLVKQFWQTVTASTLADGTLELRATINTIEYTITEASVRSQADQAGTQSQPSSSTVPPPPTSQPAPTESTTILPTPQPSPKHQPSSPRQESDIPQTQSPTHTHEAETGHMSVDDLFQLVPQLMTRIESLEKDLKQTKHTMRNAIVKLVKKVKKMEKVIKSRRVTPKQGKSSGETNISPQGLEAAKTLAEALSQIKTKRRNVKTGVRRRLDAKDVSTGFEDVSTGFEDVSTGFIDIKSASEKVSSGGEHVSASQREGKAVLEETPQTKRTKKQIREEQASLAEIARIQAEEEAENARREELKRQDELAAKRLQEELELSEAQKKRMAQVQEAAQFYTEEDWDTIRAKLEANADLVKEIAGEDVSEADYAQRMVGLISQRRKLIAEQKAKAQRDKPMTQAQQRQYMATYLKNQGGWKLAQIKKLTDEELKEKFEYLMRSMERFVPMDTEKESRKRTGVELQTESSKKLKSDTREDVSVPKEKDKESVKREEEFEIKKPVLRYTKRKSLARKGLQKKPESAKSGTEEDVEAYMEERVDEPSSEEFPMSSIPQGPAPAKIVKWQIIKTGKRGAYQIIREDNTDVVYVNFLGLLNDLTRDDLKELYRLMMLKYGDNRPEEDFERVLWGDLKTMFDPPSEEDAIWKLPHQQQILNWRYFHSCSVHCLTVEAAHIYMLTEVKYPLPPRVCKAMLEKKLLGDRKDESTMSNRHKDWLVQEQTALGKDFSNPFMADNLPKIEAHNEDIQRKLKFTSEDQVRGGLLGIIVNRLKSGSTIVSTDLLVIVIQKANQIQDFEPTFSGPDDLIPPGIESDFDSEEDIIDNLFNDDPIPEFERLTFDMELDVPMINNVDELNEDECFNPGGGEINVEVDDSFTFVTRTFLLYLTYPEVSPLLSSTENEDTIFDPGIFAFHFSSQEPIVVKCFMEFCSSTCFIPKDE
ncbi:hypothetical protein Tco_0133588 [Tanacetum coccineum]